MKLLLVLLPAIVIIVPAIELDGETVIGADDGAIDVGVALGLLLDMETFRILLLPLSLIYKFSIQ